MSGRRDPANVGVAHGRWGEDAAADYLRRGGYEIIERNVRPLDEDERLEIDIVAYDCLTETMVFVEVKQHAVHSPYARRICRIDRRKRQNLRRACNAWRRSNRWAGGVRFDVVEVYGIPGLRPEVDHVLNVNLFSKRDRFVKWN